MGTLPALLVVLSVDEQGTAQLVFSGQNKAGKWWRFITGASSEKRLTFQPDYETRKLTFDWADANKGSVSEIGRAHV